MKNKIRSAFPRQVTEMRQKQAERKHETRIPFFKLYFMFYFSSLFIITFLDI